jgi:hypothetical protein
MMYVGAVHVPLSIASVQHQSPSDIHHSIRYRCCVISPYAAGSLTLERALRIAEVVRPLRPET